MAFTDNTTGGRVMQQGLMPYRITLDDTCDVGDLIGYDAADSLVWERADANARIYANFIAGEPCRTSGDTITVFREAIISGFSDAVAGDLVYLSNTPGTYVAAPESNNHQVVGLCVSDTEAVIRPDAMPITSYNAQANPTGQAMAGFFRTQIEDGDSASACGGIRIECITGSGAGTVSSMRGIQMLMICDTDTIGNQDMVFIRMETQGAYAPNAFLEVSGNAAHFLSVLGVTTNCISKAGTSGTAAGWIKIDFGHGTDTRYINLYSGTP